ncbi:hypothetical protein E1A91_D11G233900v1 [Gossypium mustelinum]|uniref:Uncharacterized protein n=1 Tax=Gossypium mustelinum TaxID=34275 RepID=A0A5D2SUW3_GOSMU|nr:hypothetical protein E1A91_D11G233900v1 [Gossypium mustelinum]
MLMNTTTSTLLKAIWVLRTPFQSFLACVEHFNSEMFRITFFRIVNIKELSHYHFVTKLILI